MTALASSTFALQSSAEDRAAARKAALEEWQAMSDAMVEEKGLLNYPQAALLLNVSPKRVHELVRLGKFKRFDFMGRTYVSMREVRERLQSETKAGRPPLSKGKAIVASLKAAVKHDMAQVRLGGFQGPYEKKRREEARRKRKGKWL
jgi:hypothetical protein